MTQSNLLSIMQGAILSYLLQSDLLQNPQCYSHSHSVQSQEETLWGYLILTQLGLFSKCDFLVLLTIDASILYEILVQHNEYLVSVCWWLGVLTHYSGVIMARWHLKSPASRLFTQPFIHAQIKVNIKAPRHWPLCGEFTGDQWIPRTNGQ